jgi:wyosine [tRNA(Phe)-imidazoG37] synthetase (radical SAM superfamily)
LEFAAAYTGQLVTETMLVDGANDDQQHLGELGEYLARLRPGVAYLSIPTRPPAETWVQPPREEAVNRAYQILSQRVDRAEYLIGYEGNAFAFTGDVEQDLLGITAVHPMRNDAVEQFLVRAGADWAVVRRLVDEGQLVETEYGEHRFYVRRFKRRRHLGAR